MENLLTKIEEAVNYIQAVHDTKAEIGIILGTGLGNLVNEIAIEKEVSYGDIPHFPVSTVESHSGKLIFGKIGGRAVVAMQGRFHFMKVIRLQRLPSRLES